MIQISNPTRFLFSSALFLPGICQFPTPSQVITFWVNFDYSVEGCEHLKLFVSTIGRRFTYTEELLMPPSTRARKIIKGYKKQIEKSHYTFLELEVLMSRPRNGEPRFYLGKRFNPKARRLPTEAMPLGTPFQISVYDLLTHGIILGMTGSGKTIVGKIAIEEAALHGIPSILIDPKGDLSSMALVFPALQSEDFAPWVEARNDKDKGTMASELSERYKEKLRAFDIPQERLAEFKKQVKVVVLTPRSNTGIPLAISTLPSPPPNIKALLEVEPETVLDLVDTVVRTLMMRVYPGDPPEKHRTEEKYLNSIVRYAWENEIPLIGIDGLAILVDLVETPPMKKIGVMTVDRYISPRDRHELAVNINNLLVGVEQLWHRGLPLDLELILRLYSRDDKTPVIIFNLSEIHTLDDKIFIVSRIAYAIYEWMRRKGGSEEPRLMFYIDEIGGGGGKTAFFPIHPYNPPSKPPLMLLIKQARAFGVCCLFSTQNPGDIDYKGLSNCGTWIIGKLSTARDRSKVLQGLGDSELLGAAVNRRELEKQIASLKTGEFICKTKQGTVEFFQERWLMSYHKTMTAKEIRDITEAVDRKLAAAPRLEIQTRRAFVKLNHTASIDEIRRHFQAGVNLHLEEAECTYLPLLSFKINTGFTKRHPRLSKQIRSEETYGPLLMPLCKDEVDMNYTATVLGVETIRTADLLDEVEDPTLNIVSTKRNVPDVFDDVTKQMQPKIKQDLMCDLANQIGQEKDHAKKAEKLRFQPKFEDLAFELQNVGDRITDLERQKQQLTEELRDLKSEREERVRRDAPIVRISQSIRSRQRRLQNRERQRAQLQRKRERITSQTKKLQDSQNREITLIEEQFEHLKNELSREVEARLSFEDPTEMLLPICTATVTVKGQETRKRFELAWNGYTGMRITAVLCSACETVVDRCSPLNLCYVCLEVLCSEHVKTCAECGRTTCTDHSWLCACGQVHCLSEKPTTCDECEALLCRNCKHRCEGCNKALCPEHHVECPNCGKSICQACRRLEKKFLGLWKTQKCVMCI